jgi:hypothetical protein
MTTYRVKVIKSEWAEDRQEYDEETLPEYTEFDIAQDGFTLSDIFMDYSLSLTWESPEDFELVLMSMLTSLWREKSAHEKVDLIKKFNTLISNIPND